MTDTSSGEVLKVLEQNIFNRHGVPESILSDRGTNFLSDTMDIMYKGLGIKKISTTAYHPQSNGQCEVLNRTLVSLLTKFCADRPHFWYKGVQTAVGAYNGMVHRHTGMSPNKALYGRERVTLVDRLTLPETVLRQLDMLPGSIMQMIDTINRVQSLCHDESDRQKQLVMNQRNRDLDSLWKEYVLGDVVYFRIDWKQDKKFLRRWLGPCRVVEIWTNRPKVVRIQLPYWLDKPDQVVSVCRLKRITRDQARAVLDWSQSREHSTSSSGLQEGDESGMYADLLGVESLPDDGGEIMARNPFEEPSADMGNEVIETDVPETSSELSHLPSNWRDIVDTVSRRKRRKRNTRTGGVVVPISELDTIIRHESKTLKLDGILHCPDGMQSKYKLGNDVVHRADRKRHRILGSDELVLSTDNFPARSQDNSESSPGMDTIESREVLESERIRLAGMVGRNGVLGSKVPLLDQGYHTQLRVMDEEDVATQVVHWKDIAPELDTGEYDWLLETVDVPYRRKKSGSRRKKRETVLGLTREKLARKWRMARLEARRETPRVESSFVCSTCDNIRRHCVCSKKDKSFSGRKRRQVRDAFIATGEAGCVASTDSLGLSLPIETRTGSSEVVMDKRDSAVSGSKKHSGRRVSFRTIERTIPTKRARR